MSQNTSLLRHFRPLLRFARELLPGATDTVPDNRLALVTTEPYMDSLPTRRPLPRPTRVRRVQGFMQMSIDA